jgi:hypothetical protein
MKDESGVKISYWKDKIFLTWICFVHFYKILQKRITFLDALHVDTSWNTLGLK